MVALARLRSGVIQAAKGMLPGSDMGRALGRATVTGRISHLTGAGDKDTDNLMRDLASFVSVCPKCGDARAQRGYGTRALLRLLKGNHPIEAYCVVCDEFWAISEDERSEIARRLAG
jgi:hypothetical protein